jgi:hypothetical protein
MSHDTTLATSWASSRGDLGHIHQGLPNVAPGKHFGGRGFTNTSTYTVTHSNTLAYTMTHSHQHFDVRDLNTISNPSKVPLVNSHYLYKCPRA